MMRPSHFFLILILAVSVDLQSVLAQQSRQTVEKNESSSEKAVDLRVGLISYDKPEDKIRDYRAIFEELSKPPEAINYKPRFAVGTYADVVDWITRGLVDIAVLSPNAFAETTAWKRKDSGNIEPENEADCIYLATEGKAPAAQDAWVNSALKNSPDPGKGRSEYNSVCIVAAANSDIRTFDDLRDCAKDDKVQFVFGDPLSASGTILPMHFLRANHIDFRKHMEYSFGHSDSVAMILEQAENPPAPGTLTKVAFVQDLAILDTQREKHVDNRNKLRAVEETETIKGLRDALLPMEVWVARKDFDKNTGGPLPPGTQKKSDKFRAALLAHVARNKSVEDKQQAQGQEKPKERTAIDPPIRDFTYHDELALEKRITPLYAWAQEIKGLLAQPVNASLEGDYSGDAATKTTGMKFPVRFQDVVSLIRHYNRMYEKVPKKARLALVLSGGGAKCAYQAGAIEPIEKVVADLSPPGTPPVSEVDIDLVVGTSGGALNAVPIAVGISRGSYPKSPLASTWTELNALQIIRPPWMVAICLGFCYAFLYFVGIRGFVRLIRSRTARLEDHAKWIRLLGWLFITIPALVLLLFYFPGLLHPLLQVDSHLLFYFLLAISCGIFVAAPLCVIWGVLVLANAHERDDEKAPDSQPIHRRFLLRLVRWSNPRHPIPFLDLALVGMILVGIALVFALTHGGGLFLGDPLEKVVIEQYAKLFAGKSQEDLRANNGKELGKAIRDWPGRKRDLVITGSSLTKDSRGSKYFYLPGTGRADGARPPSYGTHGVEIGTDCDIDRLVDIALGSGTIFPFFPSHEVKGSDERNNEGKRRYPLKTVDLIDGGFAHNSPIEAATRWNATHIILLNASPETVDRGKPKSPFVSNILKAIGYLFDQAQAADVNAQEEAAVFTLRPSAEPKPQITILDFGPGFVEDALRRGRDDAMAWSFVRQPAKPLFWEAQAASGP